MRLPSSPWSTGLALATLAAVLFSFKAILAKWIYVHGTDPITLMALRMGLAAPVFAWVAWRQSRAAARRGDQLQPGDWGRIALLGFLGYYLSSLLDFMGLQYVPAALERLILFLTPTLVLLLTTLVLRRPVARTQKLALAISYAGIVLVFVEHLRFDGGRILLGSALVFGAALSYAGYLVWSGEMVRRLGSLRLVSYVMTISTGLTLAHYLLVHPLAGLWQPAPVLGLSVGNALACTVAPVFLTMAAVERIGAPATSQLSMIGPVSLLFLGHWLLGERITAVQVVGTAIVVGGIVWLGWQGGRARPSAG
jgi:drug/metabolite transporter (DMT)-like permease